MSLSPFCFHFQQATYRLLREPLKHGATENDDGQMAVSYKLSLRCYEDGPALQEGTEPVSIERAASQFECIRAGKCAIEGASEQEGTNDKCTSYDSQMAWKGA